VHGQALLRLNWLSTLLSLVAVAVDILLEVAVLAACWQAWFLWLRALHIQSLLVVAGLVVRAVRLGVLGLTLFLALYLLQEEVLAVLLRQLLALLVVQGVVQTILAALAAHLVKEYLVRVTLVDCLGLVQTIQGAAAAVLEQLD
jgi:hypothetical protein